MLTDLTGHAVILPLHSRGRAKWCPRRVFCALVCHPPARKRRPTMTPHLRRAFAAALCAGAALALTACSSADGSPTTAAAAGSAVATPSPADPNAGLPNGTKMTGWLLPAGVVPKLKADSQAVDNSGDVYLQPADKTIPKAQACDQLGQTDWMDAGGIGPSAAAGDDFADAYGNEYYQQVNAYQTTRA